MKLTDHLRLIWPNRSFIAVGDDVTFHDAGPMPTKAELDATLAQAQALYDAEQASQAPPPPPLTVPGSAFLQAIGRTQEITLKAKINEIPNLDTRRHMMLYLSYPYFVSNHPVIAQIAATMGKTDEEVYAYFQAAHAIAYPSGQ